LNGFDEFGKNVDGITYRDELAAILKKMTETEYLARIEGAINEIESIDYSNSWSYEQVIHSILKIPHLPIILFTEPRGNSIFRSRINNDMTPYYSISDISLPKEEFVLNFARANKPKQSLFYGSENRPTSYMEFAMHLAETTPFNKVVSLTVGRWEIQRNLIFALVFNPTMVRNNVYNNTHGEFFDDFISKTPEELRKGTIKLFEFIAEKYANQVEHNDIKTYLITCAYSNIIFSYGQCDGIMYPSVPRLGDAFNVVIKKNSIDEGVLVLRNARMDKFVAREQSNGKHEFLNIASMDADKIGVGKIEWSNKWEIFS
jgi:hypothetical protein